MQPDDKHINDLDYLAKRGFEQLPVTDADLSDLVKKVKARSFSYNSGLYFGFLSLAIGVFIGLSLFFVVSKEELSTLPKSNAPVIVTDSLPLKTERMPETIALNEVLVVNDNFIDPHAKPIVKEAEAPTPVAQVMDSIISMPERPVDALRYTSNKLQEAKLKFIANAPVMYVHDLKVTNYRLLYFRQNHFVEFTGRPGVAADRAGKTNFQELSHLKESADYFLHEELAEALLYFKNGKYDQCIQSLNLVSSYNDHDLNCDFYLAMCYYYKHNYTKAIFYYDACVGDPNNTFLQESEYYKAVSLLESGNKTEALAAFKKIVDEEGFYAEKAKGFLK